MKVEITENGTLMVTPENGLENFALDMWFKAYTIDDAEKEVVLLINTYAVDRSTGRQQPSDA